MFKNIIIVLFFLLTACAGDQNSETTESKQQKSKSSVFDAQLDSLEKAKQLESDLDEAVKKRDKAMSDQGI